MAEPTHRNPQSGQTIPGHPQGHQSPVRRSSPVVTGGKTVVVRNGKGKTVCTVTVK